MVTNGHENGLFDREIGEIREQVRNLNAGTSLPVLLVAAISFAQSNGGLYKQDRNLKA